MTQSPSKIQQRPGPAGAFVPILCVKPLASWWDKFKKGFDADKHLEWLECDGFTEVSHHVRQFGQCIVLLMCGTVDDVILHLELLTELYPFTDRFGLKILVTGPAISAPLRERLESVGCVDYLPEPISLKAFSLKLAGQLRAVQREQQDWQKQEAAQRAAASVTRGSALQGKTDPKQSDGGRAKDQENKVKYRMGPALTLASDFWLFEAGAVRRLNGRWMVRMFGPGPAIGRWKECDVHPPFDQLGETSATHTHERYWRWVPHPRKPGEAGPVTDDLFAVEGGEWIYRGIRPEYIEDYWSFVGTDPSLVFSDGERALGHKFWVDTEETMVISTDSARADEIRAAILKSLDRVFRAEPRARGPADRTQEQEPEKPELFLKEELSARMAKLHAPIPQEILDEADQLFSLSAASGVPSVGGPELFLSADPKLPLLSPLSVAFLVSELLGNPELDRSSSASRYCRYLGASCGGVRVELWVRAEDRWNWVGSDDGTPGIFLKQVEALDAESVLLDPETLGTLILEEGQVQGALIFSGKKAAIVSHEYAISVGQLASGLLKSFSLPGGAAFLAAPIPE